MTEGRLHAGLLLFWKILIFQRLRQADGGVEDISLYERILNSS
jgi:hypothetical protein